MGPRLTLQRVLLCGLVSQNSRLPMMRRGAADAPKKEEGEAADKPTEEAKAEEPAPESTN